MIVLHQDSQHDTSVMKALYDGLDNIKLLYNPKRVEFERVMRENPNEMFMCIGHGTSFGLFGYHETNNTFIIDSNNVHLLKDRDNICIWCNACDFAKQFSGIRGFFTDMFISNPSEAKAYGFIGHTEKETDEQNIKFCNYIRNLISNKTDLSEWAEKLQGLCDKDIDFVAFNYGILYPEDNAMMYFDGTQKPQISFYLNDYDYAEDRQLSDILNDLGNRVDDIRYIIYELRSKKNSLITDETLDKWEETLDEMEEICYFT